jgi:hypothetical protein
MEVTKPAVVLLVGACSGSECFSDEVGCLDRLAIEGVKDE